MTTRATRRRRVALWLCVALCGSVWLCGAVWRCVALCGPVWVHTIPSVILTCVIGWQVVMALHGGSLWSCHVPLNRRLRRRSPTFCHTVLYLSSCLLWVSRSLPFVGRSNAICSGSRGSRLVGGSEILWTLYSKGWATNRPPTKWTIDGKVALSGVTLLRISPILGAYNRRPVRGRHVASPIEILRIVLWHC